MKLAIPEKQNSGLTLTEVLVITLVIAVLAALLLPALLRPGGGHRINCANNLKQIGLAARIFATDHEEKFPWQVSTNAEGSREYRDLPNSSFRHFEAMSNELTTPRILHCAHDKERISAIDWQIGNQNISYFLGLDATESTPQLWLAGDRNLMTNGLPVGSGLLQLTTNLTVGWTARIHNRAGYLLFGDGHVDSVSNGRLQEQLNHPSVATNRLLIP